MPFRRDGQTLDHLPEGSLARCRSPPRGPNARERHGEGSTTVTLSIAPLTEKPRVRFSRFNASDRPLVEFTVRVARGQLSGNGGPDHDSREGRDTVSLRPVVSTALFTLPIAGARRPGLPERPAGHARHESAEFSSAVSSAFDPDNFAEQIPVPAGGTGGEVKLSFDGTGRTVNGRRRGVLARRGLVVEVVQGGRVLGRLSTGILCVNPGNTVPRCRLPGYRTRSF